MATSILADYAADRPDVLAELLMDADEKQFAVIYPKLKERGEEGLPFLQGEIEKPLPDAAEEVKEALAKRQANAAVALLRLNQPEKVWPLLKHSPDPTGAELPDSSIRPAWAPMCMSLVRRLGEEPDVSSRRALILSLGEFDVTQFPAAERKALIARLLDLYRSDPDPGLHGAAEWLLRQKGWDQGSETVGNRCPNCKLTRSNFSKPAKGATSGSGTSTRQGQTFVILKRRQTIPHGIAGRRTRPTEATKFFTNSESIEPLPSPPKWSRRPSSGIFKRPTPMFGESDHRTMD